MKLSKLERLTLANQLKILEALYPDEADYYRTSRIALEEGYALHYEELLHHIYDELPEDQCREVVDVLAMYRAITFSLRDQTEADDPLREHYMAKFHGFDGNNEGAQFGYTRYFIIELERFEELRYGSEYPDFNSHAPMLGRYRRMLAVWREFADDHVLSRDQLSAILDA